MSENLEKVRALAIDLRTGVPRSPRDTIGGYVIAARAVDKGRADIVGWQGEYHFDCPLTHIFLEFAGIDVTDFRTLLATGVTDEEVGAWIQAHATSREKIEVVRFNNEWREKRLGDLVEALQLYMEDYIVENTPPGVRIYTWFDVYDAEEGRITA
ncbi:MAG: DUF5069 domain-containing protein [Candidatus Sericytochromatia bacterium]|nr:DUF5069 domain-containing protein [Candidatus Sericytochromatia bacterium]